jgi:hypothetical protein
MPQSRLTIMTGIWRHLRSIAPPGTARTVFVLLLFFDLEERLYGRNCTTDSDANDEMKQVGAWRTYCCPIALANICGEKVKSWFLLVIGLFRFVD